MKSYNISTIAAQFGIAFHEITGFYDTSRDDNDRRYSYILDNRYVLKLQSSPHISEAHLQRINRLTQRYRAIGVYCPPLCPGLDGVLSCPWEIAGCTFTCFVEEFAPYPVCGDENAPSREEVVAHLGMLASKFSGIDLWEERSMWSIIDLSPLDNEIDEKQENANDLEAALREVGLSQLADKIWQENQALRRRIEQDFRQLPRCVYQGDLNDTNLLHDDGHFSGLIDFNLAGTEVNINVFLCETNWFPETEDLDRDPIPRILHNIRKIQQSRLEVILANYALNGLEKQLFPYYRQLILLFQYPNVCNMITWLQDPCRREKAAKLLQAILEQPL